MKIDFANLNEVYLEHKESIDNAIKKVIDSSSFIMGEEVSPFENKLSDFTGAKHSIVFSNGTDELLLAMMALGIKSGDVPIFVDIDERTYNIVVTKIEEAITEKTKAIMPVSLYVQISDMDEINEIALKYDICVIEDGAQSFGATYKGEKSCNVSTIGTTSFFPAKPPGCFGDGGAVFTNDDESAERMKSMRIHGQSKRYHHKYIGMGGRLDTLQAAVLNVKIDNYSNDISRRQKVATIYTSLLKDNLVVPIVEKYNTSVWAQYSIRIKKRDDVQKKLREKGTPNAVHYPKPLHLQECYQYLGYNLGEFPISELVSEEIMSLPMNPYLTIKEQEYIYVKN